jgi:hypothetical protein
VTPPGLALELLEQAVPAARLGLFGLALRLAAAAQGRLAFDEGRGANLRHRAGLAG